MTKKSAGILLYRLTNHVLEVLLVHPGGPFLAKKDLGVWSIPKGEFTDEEKPRNAAIREFREEMGSEISGDFIEMTPIKQNNGKIVYAFALELDFDTSKIMSNTFTIEWPPKSGKLQEFPEIDRGEWFDFTISKQKLNDFQATIVDELVKKLNLHEEQLKCIKKIKSNKPQQLDLFG